MIGKYFGDENLRPCGICDNCINKKKIGLSSIEFHQLAGMIISEIKLKPHSVAALNEKLSDVPKQKIKEAVKFLQAEETIIANENGELSLKNTPFPAAASQA